MLPTIISLLFLKCFSMELSKRKINDIVKAIALLEHVFVKYLLIDVNSNSNYMLLKTNIT